MKPFKKNTRRYAALRDKLQAVGLDIIGGDMVFDPSLPVVMQQNVCSVDLQKLPEGDYQLADVAPAIQTYLEGGREARIESFNREQDAARAFQQRGNDEECLSITVGDTVVVSGDGLSVRVVFNNLSGQNFNANSLHTNSHADYIAMMEYEWGVGLRGKRVNLRAEGDRVVSVASIPAFA